MTDPSARLFHADAVLPGDARPLLDGAVVVAPGGRIVDVGPARDLVPRHAGAEVTRVRGVVFPGLVNAHTHVELSALRGRVAGGQGFVPWLDRLLTARAEVPPGEGEEAAARAVEALVRSATVAVGDVGNTLSSVSPLARAGLAGCIFHEVLGMDRGAALRRLEGLEAERAAQAPAWPSELSYAPAPHTLYTLHEDAARAVLEDAARRGARTSLHLAEHAAERAAVERGEGIVPAWYEARLGQHPSWPRRALFDVAADAGALRPGVVLVHLTDARPDELARVAATGADVVLCPRSNLWIEGRLPPLRAMREAGIEAALGTDSLASNTSLDVLEEARALADAFPDVPAWELVEMATASGARALGRADLGRIARGTRPGLFAVEGAIANDPAAFLLARVGAPRLALAPRTSETS